MRPIAIIDGYLAFDLDRVDFDAVPPLRRTAADDAAMTFQKIGGAAPMTEDLQRLAERVEALSGPDREVADEVLLACGWRLNHDADEIAQWRIDPGVAEGEDGKEYPVTLADRMNWACWYPPGNRPFRDRWIDGHYRPDPLASLDAAMTLVPDDAFWRVGHDGEGADPGSFLATVFIPQCGRASRPHDAVAETPALALTAASLRARIGGAG